MKTTKLYLSYISLWWDCWKCGYSNNVVFGEEGFYACGMGPIAGGAKITDKHLKVKCGRCGAKRKGLIRLDRMWPPTGEKRKKLEKIEKEYLKTNSPRRGELIGHEQRERRVTKFRTKKEKSKQKSLFKKRKK